VERRSIGIHPQRLLRDRVPEHQALIEHRFAAQRPGQRPKAGRQQRRSAFVEQTDRMAEILRFRALDQISYEAAREAVHINRLPAGIHRNDGNGNIVERRQHHRPDLVLFGLRVPHTIEIGKRLRLIANANDPMGLAPAYRELAGRHAENDIAFRHRRVAFHGRLDKTANTGKRAPANFGKTQPGQFAAHRREQPPRIFIGSDNPAIQRQQQRGIRRGCQQILKNRIRHVSHPSSVFPIIRTRTQRLPQPLTD